jgi:hypothetical protein
MTRLKYETPELEVTKFDMDRIVMTDFGGDNGDGDIVTDFIDQSDPDGGAGDLDDLFD